LGLDLGYGFTTVRGDDSNFRLDGDLEGFDADLLINPVKDISIGIGGRLDLEALLAPRVLLPIMSGTC